MQDATNHKFTLHILYGMLAGIVVGLLIKWLPLPAAMQHFLAQEILQTGGKIFINLLKMLVVPIVLVSLICGASALGDLRQVGRVGLKALALYLVTTACAITLALLVAGLFNIGHGLDLVTQRTFQPPQAPTLTHILINLFPANPIAALASGNMLQIIVFALLFGIAIAAVGEKARPIADFFNGINAILMRLILLIMRLAPYGVFFLLAALFAKQGFALILHLMEYFATVLVVLLIQLVGVYSAMLALLSRMSPFYFFKRIRALLLFAFSVSSSSATIPITLRTAEKKLGVDNSIASFVIPLGATINMDGTAIMQGVATVFIAHAYGLSLGISGYLMVILMATMASIGTAGVPGVGLITLSMVLTQVNLPVEGIALIIGVDRLLDMARTAVNVAGDTMIACLVARSEKKLQPPD